MCRGLGTEVQGHEDGPGKDRGWCSEDGIGAASSKVTQQEAAHIGLLEGRGPACIYHRLGFLREPVVEWVGGRRSCALYIQVLPPRGN